MHKNYFHPCDKMRSDRSMYSITPAQDTSHMAFCYIVNKNSFVLFFFAQVLDFIHMIKPKNIMTTKLPKKKTLTQYGHIEKYIKVYVIKLGLDVSMETLIIHNSLQKKGRCEKNCNFFSMHLPPCSLLQL